MFRPITLSLLLTLAVLTAGCQDIPASTEPDVEESASRMEVFYLKTYTELAATAGLPAPGSEGGGLRLRFNTTDDLVAVLLEVAWNDTVQDLDSMLVASVERPVCYDPPNCFAPLNGPSCQGAYVAPGDFCNLKGTFGAPDSPSRILATGEPLAAVIDQCRSPCEWVAGAMTEAKGPWVDVEWHAWVTVFYGSVPEGYTAVPESWK